MENQEELPVVLVVETVSSARGLLMKAVCTADVRNSKRGVFDMLVQYDMIKKRHTCNTLFLKSPHIVFTAALTTTEPRSHETETHRPGESSESNGGNSGPFSAGLVSDRK